MRALTLALFLAAPLALPAGDAHAFGAHVTGVQITAKQLEALQVGTTTQDDIRGQFGTPARREQVGDTQIWYYDYVKIPPFGKNIQEATVFEFDAKGVLVAKSKTNAIGKTGNPLIDAANGK